MFKKIKIIKLQDSGSKQLKKVKKLVKLGFLQGPCLQVYRNSNNWVGEKTLEQSAYYPAC